MRYKVEFKDDNQNNKLEIRIRIHKFNVSELKLFSDYKNISLDFNIYFPDLVVINEVYGESNIYLDRQRKSILFM